MESEARGYRQPDHPSLEGKVLDEAVKNQILTYPQVVRKDSDKPVDGQSHGLISFTLFKEPKPLKSGKLLYGFFKLRGNYKSREKANMKATNIIKNQDSKFKIRVVNVGEWLPIADDDTLVKENVNIKVDASVEEEKRELAIKEERERNERKIREIKEREEEVKNAKDYNDDPEHINFYTMKRVTWMTLRKILSVLINKSKISWKNCLKQDRNWLNWIPRILHIIQNG